MFIQNQFIKKWFYDIDKYTLFFAIGLVTIGVGMSLSVGPVVAIRLHLSEYYFTQRHIFFAILSILIIIFCSMMSTSSILNISYLGFFIFFIILILCILLGSDIKGSKRWINLGFFALQPSEMLKPFFIILNAHFLSISRINKISPIVSCFMLFSVLILLVKQPDFGMSVLYIFIWTIQVFLGNIDMFSFIGIIVVCLVLLGTIGFFLFPHFHYRIINFFTLSAGHEHYQTKKAIESIYNGGLFGTGLCEGDVKYQLPDAHTDYIFASICEELGIIIACIMLIGYLILSYRHIVSNLFVVKYNIRVIYGLTLIFVLQSILHIGININLLPSKGMTLPFISYGGSSMLSNAIIIGFLLAFTRKSYAYKTPYRNFENYLRIKNSK